VITLSAIIQYFLFFSRLRPSACFHKYRVVPSVAGFSWDPSGLRRVVLYDSYNYQMSLLARDCLILVCLSSPILLVESQTCLISWLLTWPIHSYDISSVTWKTNFCRIFRQNYSIETKASTGTEPWTRACAATSLLFPLYRSYAKSGVCLYKLWHVLSKRSQYYIFAQHPIYLPPQQIQ
jgi:hypothetical protein